MAKRKFIEDHVALIKEVKNREQADAERVHSSAQELTSHNNLCVSQAGIIAEAMLLESNKIFNQSYDRKVLLNATTAGEEVLLSIGAELHNRADVKTNAAKEFLKAALPNCKEVKNLRISDTDRDSLQYTHGLSHNDERIKLHEGGIAIKVDDAFDAVAKAAYIKLAAYQLNVNNAGVPFEEFKAKVEKTVPHFPKSLGMQIDEADVDAIKMQAIELRVGKAKGGR